MNDKLPGDDLILTHDQRLRVFVSSSMGELAEERQAVASAQGKRRPGLLKKSA